MANILVHPSVFTVSISQKRAVSNWVSENQSQIITLPNHSGHILARFSEPINYSVHVADGKHGKHVQVSHYWFWFHSFYFFTLYSFYSLLFLLFTLLLFGFSFWWKSGTSILGQSCSIHTTVFDAEPITFRPSSENITNNNSKNNNRPTFGFGAQHLLTRLPTLGGQFGLKKKEWFSLQDSINKPFSSAKNQWMDEAVLSNHCWITNY